MNQKIGAPVIAIAVVIVIGLCWFFGKQFLGSPPTNTGPSNLPSFIDPATGRPRAGAAGSGGGMPGPSGSGGSMSGGSGGSMMSGGSPSGGR